MRQLTGVEKIVEELWVVEHEDHCVVFHEEALVHVIALQPGR